jgi:hypothetical protein
MTKAADLALGKIAALKTALIEFTDGDDAIAVADAGVVTLLTTAVAKSEGGAVTTNIAQGVAKQWIHYDQSGTIAIDDSFNTTSITDVSTGVATVTIANDMANINFCVAGSTMGSTGSFNAWIQGVDVVHTASSYRALSNHVSSGVVDLTHCQTIAHGDLA